MQRFLPQKRTSMDRWRMFQKLGFVKFFRRSITHKRPIPNGKKKIIFITINFYVVKKMKF